MIRILHFDDKDFEGALQQIVGRGETAQADVQLAVQEIIEDVRRRGDSALIEYTERFDRLSLTAATLEVTPEEIDKALVMVSEESLAALEKRFKVNIWQERNVYFGGVHTVIPGADCVGDPRRGGAVAEVPA